MNKILNMSRRILFAALLLSLCCVVGCSSKPAYDYQATVQAWRPFRSQGMSYTVGEVFSDLSSNVTWETEELDYPEAYVTASFELDGDSYEAKFYVSVDEENDSATEDIVTFSMNGEEAADPGEPLFYMFELYEQYKETA